MYAQTTTPEFCIRSSNHEHGQARQLYRVPLPASDIDQCIQFSRLRCLLSLFSLLLVCSDIPRTGLGIKNMTEVMTPTSPSAGIHFGPYAYQTAHIIRVLDGDAIHYEGSRGGQNITATQVWAYKLDSVSITQRALVHELGVQAAWPRCLLYYEDCPSEQLSLETTFRMQDALVTSVHEQLFPDRRAGITSRPSVYLAWSKWSDRLHHKLIEWFSWHRESRIFSIHYYQLANQDNSTALNVCDIRVPFKHRPVICSMEMVWMCPSVTGTDTNVRIESHIQSRIDVLRQQSPHLFLDMTLIFALNANSNRNDGPRLGLSFVQSEYHEVTTLIRGRSCSSGRLNESECETVFLDDYRYERAALVTDINQWYRITSALRAFSQFYMWIRVVILWIGCYKARSCEPKYANATHWQLWRCTWATFFRIPGNVVVYAGWIPILGYSVAHLIDVTLVHMHADFLGASLNGSERLDFWTYLTAASVQMRDIWMLALLIKAFVLIQTHLAPFRWRRKFGLICIRGGYVGFIAALTVAAPYKRNSYRNSQVLTLQRLPVAAILPQGQLRMDKVEFGFRLDIKTVFEAAYFTFAVVMIAKLCLKILRYWNQSSTKKKASSVLFGTGLFACRSYYVPYSVGTIFSCTYLSIFWRMRLVGTHCDDTSNKGPRSAITPFGLTENKSVTCNRSSAQCSERAAMKHQWGVPQAQGCALHDGIFHVRCRSKTAWSMVRLTNLAMFTDPLVLLSLYGLGRRLYLYRTVFDRTERLVLLPCCPMDLQDDLDCYNLIREYELVDYVDSSSVPWSLLLQCG